MGVAALALGLGLLRCRHFLSQTQRPHIGPDLFNVAPTFRFEAALAGISPAWKNSHDPWAISNTVHFFVRRKDQARDAIVPLARARRWCRFRTAMTVRSPNESPQATRRATVQETGAGQGAAVLDPQQRRSITSENAPSSG